MSSRIGRVCLGIAAGFLALYAYQFAMTQAIYGVIASQPPAPELAPGPTFTLSDCDLGLNLYQSGHRKPACQFDPPSPPKAEPIATMSKQESLQIGFWFLLAQFAVPMGLGAFALTGYLVIRTKFGSGDANS